MRSFTFYLLLIFCLCACTTQVKKAPINYFERAVVLKEETETIQLAFKERLKNLQQQRNNILIQGQTLTKEELAFTDEVDRLITKENQLKQYLEDISKSENAYEPNGEELYYLNQQANKIAKQIQKGMTKLKMFKK